MCIFAALNYSFDQSIYQFINLIFKFMRKRLLLAFTAILCVISSSAVQVGDYVFTHSGRYKVIGENLVANGNFTANYDGWTDITAMPISPDFWSVQEGAGPNGQNVLQSLSNADEQNGAFIFQSIPFEPSKSYIITLKIKSAEPGTSSVTEKAANYVDVYASAEAAANKSAERFQQIATTEALQAEWTEYSFAFTDTVTGGSTGYINIAIGRLLPESQITDISVNEVTEVYDTRKAQTTVDYAKKMLAITEFTEERENLESITEALDYCLQNNDGSMLGINFDDFSSSEDFMVQFEDLIKIYMDANSYDLVNPTESRKQYITNGQFTQMPDLRNGSTGNGDWHWGGSGRWFHRVGSDYDPTKLYDYIQASYDLGSGFAYIEKDLPAGKYLFQLDIKGWLMAGTSSALRYTPNYDSKIEGCVLYINNDTINLPALQTRDYRTEYIIVNMPEKGVLRAGFIHPQLSDGTKLGGEIDLCNPVLRLFGTDAGDRLEGHVVAYNIATQQNAAKVMIDSAKVVVVKPEYPWGKAELQAAIEYWDGAYNWSFTAEPTQEVADSLTQVMRGMRTDINNFYAFNKPYTDLAEYLPKAQAVYDDPANASASASARTAFKAALDNANALIAGVTATRTDDDVVNFENALAQLIETEEAFRKSTASFANPSPKSIVNKDFADHSGGNTSTFKAPGWDIICNEGNGKWQYGTSANFEGGSRISSWRGYTGWAFNKASQKITLVDAGAYEFVCQAYANNENGGRDTGYETPTGIKYYVKDVNVADSIGSIDIHTYMSLQDSLGYGGDDMPEWFVVVLNKTDNNPLEVEFGMDALSHDQTCNRYGYGSNNIYFCGPYADYTADLKAALTADVNSAEAQLAPFNEDQLALTEATVLANVKEHAKKALDETPGLQSKWYRMLKRARATFDAFVTGIKGVVAEDVATRRPVVEGVYNLSGVKVGNSIENLPKGLYIVNGKKYIVK